MAGLCLTLVVISTFFLVIQGSPLPCGDHAECCLVLDGEGHQALELSRPGAHSVLVQGSGRCKLRMLAIGGGGHGNGHCGGGSGYLQYKTMSLEDIVIIDAWVGAGNQASTAIFNLDSNITVTAVSDTKLCMVIITMTAETDTPEVPALGTGMEAAMEDGVREAAEAGALERTSEITSLTPGD